MHILVHLGEISLQTNVLGPGGHFPAHGRRLCPDRFHLLLHLFPDTGDTHEGCGTHLLQGVYKRALIKEDKILLLPEVFISYK